MTEAPKKNRLENIVAFMMVGVIGVSLLSIIFVFLCYLFKFTQIPVFVPLIPEFGLPLGALLLITLVILQIRARRKSDQGK
jgi:hypothetical protein